MRKVEFITKQMEKIQPMLQEKYRTKQGDPSGFGFLIPLFHFCLFLFSFYILPCCRTNTEQIVTHLALAFPFLCFISVLLKNLYSAMLQDKYSTEQSDPSGFGFIIIIDNFLYSAILCSRANSLRLHVILHEWIAFYSAFLNIHRSGVLTALAWLVPHGTAATSARSHLLPSSPLVFWAG